ncbi:MAG: NAD(P)/FAD-dependent oxidoreductase [Candidatus Ratteibacteria bacterium]
MRKNKYLIIGNSISGVSCIEGIREIDKDGEIFVFSDEESFNYSRPLVSYYLAGRLNEDNLNFRDENFYKEKNVKLFIGTKVKRIDIKHKTIFTDKGAFEFDFLFIGTGGRPIIPKIKGIEDLKEGIFTFTKLNDAKSIRRYIEREKIKEAVILGGGLIGLKCAEGLIEKGINVIIFELSDRILPNTFDLKASEIIENKLKERGCEVIKKNTVERVNLENGKLKEIILKDGRKIKTKILVIGVGVIPETEIVENTEIERNKGIIVNEYMQTNVPYVFSGGDVAEGYDFFSKRNSVIAIWPIAARMGKIAGYNMAGGDKKYDGMFIMNSIEFFEIPVISYGITNPDLNEKFEIIEKIEKNFYRKIVLKENKIVGAIYLGNIERAGIILGLMKNKVDVSSFKNLLIDDKFGLLILPESYRKHIVKGEGIEV